MGAMSAVLPSATGKRPSSPILPSPAAANAAAASFAALTARLDYLDPAEVDPEAWAADPDTLVVNITLPAKVDLGEAAAEEAAEGEAAEGEEGAEGEAAEGAEGASEEAAE